MPFDALKTISLESTLNRMRLVAFSIKALRFSKITLVDFQVFYKKQGQ